MKVDCYPVTVLPHTGALYRDYLSSCGGGDDDIGEKLRPFYSPFRCANRWMSHAPQFDPETRQAIVSLLHTQNREFGASPATEANLDRFAQGASAVVTGQQAGLFGGPLLTLLKAATAIRLAADASRSGHPHVPIFWIASEDHDFAEVNQATFPDPNTSDPLGFETLALPTNPLPGSPVGNVPLGENILPVFDKLRRCLGNDSISDLLAALYTPAATFASAFAAFLARIFADHGLIVMDAATHPYHNLAKSTLRAAIENVDEIRSALMDRNRALEQAGYSPQVMVSGSSSLLFVIDNSTRTRDALKYVSGKGWSTGGRHYSTFELLEILEFSPERISPSALLRPVVQDTLLPTSAYIGGPAEIAYFAQSQAVYENILGRTTPILPRFSATLVGPGPARLLQRHGLTLPDVFTTSRDLAQRLGARSMPAATKRRLAAAGNTLDRELNALGETMHAQDEGLGHAADIAASKMRYQMNRLRRMSANFAVQKNESLRRHADSLCGNLFPHGELQERALAGAWFLAKYGHSLVDALVESAQSGSCGHHALYL